MKNRLLILLALLLATILLADSALAYHYYVPIDGSAVADVHYGWPTTIAQYVGPPDSELKLAVESVAYASATAKGRMSVLAQATETASAYGTMSWYMKGWLTAGGVGIQGSSIMVKFQAIDMTDGVMIVDNVLFNANNPFQDGGTYYYEQFGISLIADHIYTFAFYVEVNAYATPYISPPFVGRADADFGGLHDPGHKIKWNYLYIPFTEGTSGGGGGGCPYVSAWNGSSWQVDNNLIPAAEYSNGTDVTDHYLLQQPLVREDGKHSLRIWDLDKHSFLDHVQLTAVDHEAEVNVAVTPYGQILTYQEPTPPIVAFNKKGTNVRDLIKEQDNQYYQGFADDFIQLDFSGTDIRNGAKLVIRSDPEECWYSCLKSPVYIQTLNSTGLWQTISTIYTRLYWTTDIIDMSSHLPDANSELKIRISFTSNDRIDFIGLDTSREGEFDLHYANLAMANHTRLGDIKESLIRSDDQRVELLPRESITLKFTLPQNTEEKRDFIIVLEGHYFIIA